MPDPETTPQTEQVTDKKTPTELLPKSTQTGRDWGNAYYAGVLVAVREANSLNLNSVGPLWILEIVDEDPAMSGKLVRSFENPGKGVHPGNPGDDTAQVWFQVQKMLRTDMSRIEVAVNLRNTPPEPEEEA